MTKEPWVRARNLLLLHINRQPGKLSYLPSNEAKVPIHLNFWIQLEPCWYDGKKKRYFIPQGHPKGICFAAHKFRKSRRATQFSFNNFQVPYPHFYQVHRVHCGSYIVKLRVMIYDTQDF